MIFIFRVLKIFILFCVFMFKLVFCSQCFIGSCCFIQSDIDYHLTEMFVPFLFNMIIDMIGIKIWYGILLFVSYLCHLFVPFAYFFFYLLDWVLFMILLSPILGLLIMPFLVILVVAFRILVYSLNVSHSTVRWFHTTSYVRILQKCSSISPLLVFLLLLLITIHNYFIYIMAIHCYITLCNFYFKSL